MIYHHLERSFLKSLNQHNNLELISNGALLFLLNKNPELYFFSAHLLHISNSATFWMVAIQFDSICQQYISLNGWNFIKFFHPIFEIII